MDSFTTPDVIKNLSEFYGDSREIRYLIKTVEPVVVLVAALAEDDTFHYRNNNTLILFQLLLFNILLCTMQVYKLTIK